MAGLFGVAAGHARRADAAVSFPLKRSAPRWHPWCVRRDGARNRGRSWSAAWVPGAFARTLSAVQWAHEAGLPLQINTTVTRSTADGQRAVTDPERNVLGAAARAT